MPIEALKCPYCGRPQEVDSALSFRPIQCDQCGEESSLGAWRNPATSKDNVAIHELASIAFTDELYGHTLAYTILAGGKGVGSGTLVSISSHLFVATAHHTLPDHQRSTGLDGEVGLVAKEKAVCGNRSHWITRIESNSQFDVGLIELTPAAANDLNVEPIGIDRIHDAVTGDTRCMARVMGYPSAYVLKSFPREGMTGFRALSYGTETIAPEAWHAFNAAGLSQDDHVLLQFSNNENIDWSGDHDQDSSAPHPAGMSGGGIWQASAPLDDSDIWTTDRLRLIAVQTGWYPKYSVLKGTQIIYWLRLVRDIYPHLRDELMANFPRLNTLSL